MGGLRLDSREAILKGGKSGPAIVEGKSDDSLLIQAVTHTHERLKMPPSGKLSDSDVAALRSWIDKGAYWPPEDKAASSQSAEYKITPEQRAFWSFQPVRKPAAGDTIDKFILDRLKSEGLHPVERADKRTLIRRATLDLIGLPPTPEEVDAFLKDESPDAFAKVVDRLLASPRYGERWGRYWLDVARYSDDKFNSTMEELHPNAWRYRNWVIQAFNADMPYDLFVKAQIAGDSIGEPAGSRVLCAESGDAGRSRGRHQPRVSWADGRMCDLPRPQVRPDSDQRLLLAAGRVLQHRNWTNFRSRRRTSSMRGRPREEEQEHQQKVIDKFYGTQTGTAGRDSRVAVFAIPARGAKLGSADGLDKETLTRMEHYLAKGKWDHPYLKLADNTRVGTRVSAHAGRSKRREEAG